MEIQNPTVGRIVHVKRPNGDALPNHAEAAPAIVVSAHGELGANLRVFYDDSHTPGWETSTPHESECEAGYSGLVWFWPPRA